MITSKQTFRPEPNRLAPDQLGCAERNYLARWAERNMRCIEGCDLQGLIRKLETTPKLLGNLSGKLLLTRARNEVERRSQGHA